MLGGTTFEKINGVYYVEYNCVFRNPTEASYITGDDRRDIQSICQRNTGKIKHHDNTYTNTYCFMEFMDTYVRNKKYKTRPIVSVSDGVVYSCISDVEEKRNIKLARKQIIKADRYLELESKNRLYKIDRYMYADEYLKIFLHSKIIKNSTENNTKTNNDDFS